MSLLQLHLHNEAWWPWGLIFPGILALAFARTRPAGYGLIAAGYLVAFVVGQLTLPALASIALLALAGWWVLKPPFRGARVTGHVVFLGLAVLLWAHLAPGFNNPLALSGQTSARAAPGRLYLNLDKTLIAIWVIACVGWLRGRGDRRGAAGALAEGAMIGALTFLLVAPLALWGGAVAVAPEVPPYWWLWLANNALLVAFAEEAFFRGYVQGGLDRWRRGRGGAWWGLLAGALLFGLAHAGQGLAMAGLSVLAGLGYGLAYRRAGLIGAISAHLALNALHFFLLTYPGLLRLPADAAG